MVKNMDIDTDIDRMHVSIIHTFVFDIFYI